MWKTYQEYIAEKKKIPVEKQLKDLYDKGYRYITKSLNEEFLICFSLKPKKCRDLEIWGYHDKDIDKVEARPAEMIYGDIPGIAWTNRYPTEISDLLEQITSHD